MKSNCFDKYQDLESVRKAFEMVYERSKTHGESLTSEQYSLLNGQQEKLLREIKNNKAAVEFDF